MALHSKRYYAEKRAREQAELELRLEVQGAEEELDIAERMGILSPAETRYRKLLLKLLGLIREGA